MSWTNSTTFATGMMLCTFLTGGMLMGCSSTPEPPSEPSKQEIRTDSDRFFQRMGQEEGKKAPAP